MNVVKHVGVFTSTLMHHRYELFVACIGYESRASFAAKELGPRADRKVAAAFKDQKVLSYSENLSWYSEHGFMVEEVDDQRFRMLVNSEVQRALATGTNIRILVDISSMSRLWIALVVDVMRSVNLPVAMEIDFVYCLARFSPPPERLVANRYAGPVLKSFAGWTLDPDRPPSVITGLGYEQDKALGAVELLQAGDLWAFVPVSAASEYNSVQLTANSILLDSIPDFRRIEYRVERPVDCLTQLEMLADSCSKSATTIILPFGPKIFALGSLLVAVIHPQISVWRVSAGKNEEPIQREATGEVCGLRVITEMSTASTATATPVRGASDSSDRDVIC